MNTERALQVAESYIGYRSRALRTNDFGEKTGFNTEIWSGSFIETVFRESGNVFPVHFSHTASALGYARMRGLTVRTPKPGDLAFYTFGTDGAMTQPHIGIVTDVQNWKSQGIFQAIEGETAPNPSKKHVHPADGVWKRTRYAVEVLEFVRMSNWKAPKLRKSDWEEVLEAEFRYLGRGKHVESVQIALSEVFSTRLRGVHRGMWDAPTAHAYSEWQRITGQKVSGVPDAASLMLLGVETGRFPG